MPPNYSFKATMLAFLCSSDTVQHRILLSFWTALSELVYVSPRC